MNKEKQPNKNENGIRVDLLRQTQMSDMGMTEKIRYIIDTVREGRVVILESGLTPDEHALLIEKTMAEIDQDNFKGVDVESYPDRKNQNSNNGGFLDKLFSRNEESDADLTLIGPASQMETLHKDNKQISTLLTKN